jgi:hypothetical protein
VARESVKALKKRCRESQDAEAGMYSLRFASQITSTLLSLYKSIGLDSTFDTDASTTTSSRKQGLVICFAQMTRRDQRMIDISGRVSSAHR